MQLDLYKALKSINIEEPLVTAAVQAMEAHIDNRISQVSQPILAKLDALQAGTATRLDALQAVTATRFDALQSSLGSKIDTIAQVKTEKDINRRWIIGTVLGGIALVFSSSGVTVGILKAIGYL